MMIWPTSLSLWMGGCVWRPEGVEPRMVLYLFRYYFVKQLVKGVSSFQVSSANNRVVAITFISLNLVLRGHQV